MGDFEPPKGTYFDPEWPLLNRPVTVDYLFRLNGKQGQSRLTREELASGPDWKPGMPLPLDLASAEAAGHAQLRRILPDDSEWRVAEMRLERLNAQKWYLMVRFRPAHPNRKPPSDYFCVLLNLSGKLGSVEL